MNARYLTADVFTDHQFGGNQLAVFPDASEIHPDLMQQIAREFNYSETTFVLPPSDPRHTAKVRIFTPGGELQFAGHPTVGTAHVLASIGVIPLTGDETHIVFEEGVGPVAVTIRVERPSRVRAAHLRETAGSRAAATVERGETLAGVVCRRLRTTCSPVRLRRKRCRAGTAFPVRARLRDRLAAVGRALHQHGLSGRAR